MKIMKIMKIHKLFIGLGLLLTTLQTVYGQQQNSQGSQVPDCNVQVAFTGTGSTASFDNRSGLCANWAFSYTGTGFSALSVVVQSAPDNNGVPGAWVTYAGTISVGVNPNTTITQNTVRLEGFFPWMRVTLSSVTGTGSVRGRLYGYRYVSNRVVPGGSPTGAAAGALSGTYPNPLLVGVVAGQVAFGSAVAGVLGSSGTFAWDNAATRFRVGTVGATNSAVLGDTGGSLAGLWLGTSTGAIGVTNYAILRDSVGNTAFNSPPSTALIFRINNADIARFAPTTGNLLLKTTSDDGTNALQVAGNQLITGASSTQLTVETTVANNSTILFRRNGSPIGFVGNVSGVVGVYSAGGAAVGGAAVIDATGNVIIGPSPSEGNFKLDVKASGSSGTARFYDQTATTGVTQLIVRAGAGQSSTSLQTWQNAAGATLASMASDGGMTATYGTFAAGVIQITNAVNLASSRLVAWSNDATHFGTKDFSISRNAANIGQIGDGAANANGDLAYRRYIGTSIAFASLGTPLNGTFVYCADCAIANPCASGGTGALAKRLNSVWVCN